MKIKIALVISFQIFVIFSSCTTRKFTPTPKKDEDSSLYGFVNAKGVFKIKPVYTFAKPFSDGVAWVGVSEKEKILIDLNGKELLRLEDIEAVDDFINGYAYISKRVLPDYICPIEGAEDLFPSAYEKKSGCLGGIIDKRGNVIIPFELKTNAIYSDGLFTIRECKINEKQQPEEFKFGYKNNKNEWVIPPKYTNADNFSNGYAVVSTDGKLFGVINKKGNTVIPEKYARIFQYKKGEFIAFVTDTEICFIDIKKKNQIFNKIAF